MGYNSVDSQPKAAMFTSNPIEMTTMSASTTPKTTNTRSKKTAIQK